jgi:F0F1-type ATP synthase assembly protein I
LANFLELRACELRRIPLPRTRVNKGEGRAGAAARTGLAEVGEALEHVGVRLVHNAFGRSNSCVGLSRKESRMNLDRRLEVAKYLWNEYQYRHDLVWKLVFRLTAAVVVLGIIPYTQDKVVNAIHWGILVPPILGVILAVVWSLRVKLELRHLDHIRDLYRPLQDSLFYKFHEDAKSTFSQHIRFYLCAVTVFAVFNVVFSSWIVAGKPWFG